MPSHKAPAWAALLVATVLAGCGSVPGAAPGTNPGSAGPGATASIATNSPAGASAGALPGDCLQDAPKPPADARRVVASRVVDGDTLHLADGSTVRLIGINTPESVDPRRPVQAYGKEASSYLKRMLEGKEVLLEPGRTPRDRYGRQLAWLWLPDGQFVNGLLVRDGYAQVYTFSDNPDHAQELRACQREARAATRGLWALEVYQSGEEAAKMDRGGGGTAAAGAQQPGAGTPQPAEQEPRQQQPGAPATSVRIIREPGTVARGSTATVAAGTSPGASCAITVTYKSGPSQAKGLEPRQASGSGEVTWSWTVSTSTATGSWPVRVSCGGQYAETSITVK